MTLPTFYTDTTFFSQWPLLLTAGCTWGPLAASFIFCEDRASLQGLQQVIHNSFLVVIWKKTMKECHNCYLYHLHAGIFCNSMVKLIKWESFFFIGMISEAQQQGLQHSIFICPTALHTRIQSFSALYRICFSPRKDLLSQ